MSSIFEALAQRFRDLGIEEMEDLANYAAARNRKLNGPEGFEDIHVDEDTQSGEQSETNIPIEKLAEIRRGLIQGFLDAQQETPNGHPPTIFTTTLAGHINRNIGSSLEGEIPLRVLQLPRVASYVNQSRELLQVQGLERIREVDRGLKSLYARALIAVIDDAGLNTVDDLRSNDLHEIALRHNRKHGMMNIKVGIRNAQFARDAFRRQ